MEEKKYGLIIRAPKSQKNQKSTRPKPVGFNFGADDDDDNIEQANARHATKMKLNKDVEKQHKKALEEDPSVFDYDGAYDDIKSQIMKPKVEDRQQKQPKYIQALMEKAKKREREHEIIYERKLAKERSKEEHLYADKDKFITNAYKKKLAEQKQWEMEEKMREKREEMDDVTKKSDISDFYFNLYKNVAYGAADKIQVKQPEKPEKDPRVAREELKKPESHEKEPALRAGEIQLPSTTSATASPSTSGDRTKREASAAPKGSAESMPHVDISGKEIPATGEQPANEQPKGDHHKKNEDALAAAKARFLARKKAKVDY